MLEISLNLKLISLIFLIFSQTLFAQNLTYWAGNGETGDHSEALVKQNYVMVLDHQVEEYLDFVVEELIGEYTQFDMFSPKVIAYKKELIERYQFIFNFSNLAVETGLIVSAPVIMLKKGAQGAVAGIINNKNSEIVPRNPSEFSLAIFVGTELAKYSFMDKSYGLPAILCHELGHHKGKLRTDKVTDLNLEFSVEGSSDEYAASECLPKILNPEIDYNSLSSDDEFMLNKCKESYMNNELVEKCLSIALSGKAMATYRGAGSLWNDNPFQNALIRVPNVVSYKDNHPSSECTLAIYASAALCLGGSKRSKSQCLPQSCWYGDKNRE
jgi:hypothetical protein